MLNHMEFFFSITTEHFESIFDMIRNTGGKSDNWGKGVMVFNATFNNISVLSNITCIYVFL